MRIGEEYNPHRLFYGLWVPQWLATRPKVSQGAKLCFAVLARHAGQDGRCFPGMPAIADALGVSERQARDYIRELEIIGLIHSHRPGLGQTNSYTFLWHEWADGSDPERNHCSDQDRNNGSDPRARDLSQEEESHVKRLRSKRSEPDEVETAWQKALATYPPRSGSREVAKGRVKFASLVASGVEAERIIAGVERYAAWAVATGNAGTQYVKHIASFLNGRGWEEDWDVWTSPPAKNGGNGSGTLSFEDQNRQQMERWEAKYGHTCDT